jgi:hypothetical protein
MAIKANSSNEAVVGAGQKLYTGISEFKVIMVNPDLETLNKNGVMLQKEPSYTVNFGENDLTKIVLWLENADTKVSCEFLVSPGPWTSKKGKIKCLNRLGQDQWLVEEDGKFDTSNLPDWIKEPETFYPIPRGLDKLTDFVRAWANVADGDEIMLETISDLEKGKVKEIKDLITALKDNTVRVLVYVRDGKYMASYTEHFGRVNPKRDDLFIKAMSGEYGAIKGDYSIEWKEYTPGVVSPDPVTSDNSDADWNMPETLLVGTEAFEDDPFK